MLEDRRGGIISPLGVPIRTPAHSAMPAKPSKPSQGRRSLRQTMFEDIAHAVDSLAAAAQAAADHFLSATLATDVSPPAAPPAAGPAQPATTQACTPPTLASMWHHFAEVLR